MKRNEVCSFCELKATQKDKHGASYVDPCLGILPGVLFACCGHGGKNEGYIYFENGKIIRFDELTESEQVLVSKYHEFTE